MVKKPTRRRAVDAFRTAFGVAPEIAREVAVGEGLGIYGWNTPHIEGFELPATDELVLALHLGGSRHVRAVTQAGLSREQSIPGMVTILPPGRPVAFRTEGSIRVATLHLPRPREDDGPLARLARNPEPRFAFRDSYVSAAMETLLRAARTARPLRPDYIVKVADALLSHLAEWADALSEEPANDSPLRELLAWIDAHIAQKLTLDELAARAGTSRALFTRRFRSATGQSPHQYLTRRRVEIAQRLLRDTERDLAWIAQETGFSSQSHFTAWFRTLTGSTPGLYRERN